MTQISRKTTSILATVYQSHFSYRDGVGYRIGKPNQLYKVSQVELFDFLFEHNYPTWLCNKAKLLEEQHQIKELIMDLHTGELEVDAFAGLPLQQRNEIGQKFLFNLAQDILGYVPGINSERIHKITADLITSLQTDGFDYREGILALPTHDVIDIKSENDLLKKLYLDLNLANAATTFHHLKLANEHYSQSKWEDSIINSRKLLESILREVAVKLATVRRVHLDQQAYRKPAIIRNFLKRQKFLEQREELLLENIYALLSEQGAHPYMARSEQARLLRQMTIIWAQYVLLRLQHLAVNA
jgi:hypothetical protein